MTSTLFLILAFFCGSIPTGYVIGRLKGVDLRKIGSGNIGATNAGRALGKRAGIYTLVGDLVKGIVAVQLSALTSEPATTAPLFGFAAILGHCFSPFLKFRGGKGVATSLGVFLVLTPLPIVASIILFGVVAKLSGYVSLGSIISAIGLPCFLLLDPFRSYNQLTVAVTIAVASLVLIRHRSNIARLLQGKELGQKSQVEEAK